MRKIALLALLPILGGCINDSIGMRIDGPEHAVSLVREQKLFWEKKMDLEVVVARLPDCQRRHKLQPAAVSPNFKIEVFMTAPNSFLLEQGKHLYAVETQTCQKFAKLDEAPKEGKGELVGVFREEKGKLVFVAAQPATPPAK
ncbi:MAG: hypothetical protein L6Q60_14700 [Rhodocyclaceae bacterium]|nr:hypothetical protein [Rhodocyclaceae bacterium]